MLVVLVLRRLRQEDSHDFKDSHYFQASLGHQMRPCLKNQNRLLVAYAFNSSTHKAKASSKLVRPCLRTEQKSLTNFMS